MRKPRVCCCLTRAEHSAFVHTCEVLSLRPGQVASRLLTGELTPATADNRSLALSLGSTTEQLVALHHALDSDEELHHALQQLLDQMNHTRNALFGLEP